jgi:hypothetical protein
MYWVFRRRAIRWISVGALVIVLGGALPPSAIALAEPPPPNNADTVDGDGGGGKGHRCVRARDESQHGGQCGW